MAEVRVSVPVKMITSKNHVYGDGQTNASLSFGQGWNQKHPQLVATLIKYKNGDRKVLFHFSPTIKVSQIHLISNVQASSKSLKTTLPVKKIKEALLAEWTVPSQVIFGDDFTSQLTWVRIDGWTSTFPIDFRMSIHSNEKLIQLSQNHKTLQQNPMDPIKVFERSRSKNEIPQSILLNGVYGNEWFRLDPQGSAMLSNNSVHGNIGLTKTAVGGGLTWFIERGKNSTFKNLYTCFQPRNYQAESDEGVPSGAGWHEIGDPAETIINNMETGPVIVGSAIGLPWPKPPETKNFSWELSDIVTIRLLMPGEALMTGAGDQTWKEDFKWRKQRDDSDRGQETSGGGRHYHWFIFNSDRPTCTQEWVHNCIPTANNDLGLNEKASQPERCF